MACSRKGETLYRIVFEVSRLVDPSGANFSNQDKYVEGEGVAPTSEREPGQYSWARIGVVMDWFNGQFIER